MSLKKISQGELLDASSIRSKVPDFMSSIESDIDGLRLGWTSDFGYANVEPEVLQICREAASLYKSLGATVDDSDFCILLSCFCLCFIIKYDIFINRKWY